MSLNAIACQLGVSKSSVSVWVRDVPPSLRDPPRPREPPPPKAPGRPLGAAVKEGLGKTCGRCRRQLTLESFNRAGDGRQDWCRECFRVYFRERGDLHAQQVRSAKAARVAAAKAYLIGYLTTRSCVDCGEDEIAVLEFDHVGDKLDNVTKLMFDGASVDRLKRELAACEVVCVCCHRRRTARRAGWVRVSGDTTRWTKAQRRNYSHVTEVLTFSGCVDCGERDPLVLEFDHVGGKESNVAALAAGAALQRLKIEIAQCEVRCCNCHRLATIVRRGGGWRSVPGWLAPTELSSTSQAPVV